MTYDEILDFEYEFEDSFACSLRQHLHFLLERLWDEGEGFSGKRPFGNSGWEFEIYQCLIESGGVPGEVVRDEEGFVEDVKIAKATANELVFQLIDHIFEKKC